MNLGQVVQHGHQLPLPINFAASSQGKTIQTDIPAQMPEDRLDDAEAHAVIVASQSGIDLVPHPGQDVLLRRRVRVVGQALQQDIDEPGAFLGDRAHALWPESAAFAVGLMPLELHEHLPADPPPRAAQPHRLARRADAGPLINVDAEVCDRVPLLGTLRHLDLFSRSRLRLVPPGGGKAGVASAKAVVGHVGVDLLFFEVLQAVFAVKTAVGQHFGLA